MWLSLLSLIIVIGLLIGEWGSVLRKGWTEVLSAFEQGIRRMVKEQR
jgi:hypothetical protein